MPPFLLFMQIFELLTFWSFRTFGNSSSAHIFWLWSQSTGQFPTDTSSLSMHQWWSEDCQRTLYKGLNDSLSNKTFWWNWMNCNCYNCLSILLLHNVRNYQLSLSCQQYDRKENNPMHSNMLWRMELGYLICFNCLNVWESDVHH